MSNVDTDQIIPARFLHLPRKAGYGDLLFHDLRESQSPAFAKALNANTGNKILVAGSNFGCGSSREAAVYALVDAGFRAVVAASFGGIFFGNAIRNGLVPAQLSLTLIESIWKGLARCPDLKLTLDLLQQRIEFEESVVDFSIEPNGRQRLLDGADEIAISLSTSSALDAFESHHWKSMPWLRQGISTQRNRK